MRPTRIQINSANLFHNISQIKNRANCELIPVVKANAYGHGLQLITKLLNENKINKVAVAFPSEAKQLRMGGNKCNILSLVPPRPQDAQEIVEMGTESSIADIDTLLEINRQARLLSKTINLHLFINSGMNREGIAPRDALGFLREASELDSVKIIGLMTHLPDAEFSTEKNRLSDACLNIFEELLISLKNSGFTFKEIHAFNSAGIINLKSNATNFARPGISIYGVLPSEDIKNKIDLKPVLSLHSAVISIKKVEKGETVGYSQKYICEQDTQIAIIPIGYGDGYSVALSNKGQCLISGKRYNVAGSVCMDQIMVDIGMDKINAGDEVVLIGKDGDEEITVSEIAAKIGTIPYEVLTMLSARVPRLII